VKRPTPPFGAASLTCVDSAWRDSGGRRNRSPLGTNLVKIHDPDSLVGIWNRAQAWLEWPSETCRGGFHAPARTVRRTPGGGPSAACRAGRSAEVRVGPGVAPPRGLRFFQ
jgi:hypothetical protein